MNIGGARSRSGPAPNPDALRRDRPSDQATWKHLPAAGRDGPAPDWPLTRPTARERTLWEREWHRPQAVAWEEAGLVPEVAMYVRSLAVAERPKASVTSRTLLRQQQDALGLSIPGLRMNRWIIVDAVEPARPQVAAAGRASINERLKLIEGGA